MATERDLDQVPRMWVGHLVGGELFVHPWPDAPHVHALTSLSVLLVSDLWLRSEDPKWKILARPEIRFGDDILVVDLAGWRRERFRCPKQGPFRVVPDWVCEVLSPETADFDRKTKLGIYARQGVSHAWLVDPDEHTLEVMRSQGSQWVIEAALPDKNKVRAEPFASVELDLTDLWISD